MELQFTADGAAETPELFIHLDIDGLAALLRAVQTAMECGRGRVVCAETGIAARCGASAEFSAVTVTFSRPGDSNEAIPADANRTPARTLEPAAAE
jgi:hypothetical protein